MIARTDTALRVPIGTFVAFTLERPVASSKNRRRLFARGRRVISLPSEQATSDAAAIRTAALRASEGVRFHPDDILALDYEHNVATDRVRVMVRKVGEMPSKGKRGTRRDVHGMCETLADAMQGVLYDDDRAFDVVTIRRARA